MIKPERKLKVAIIGSGNIGTDLLIKVLRSPHLECTVFIGRDLSSAGMVKASSLGVPISALPAISELVRTAKADTADFSCHLFH